MRCRSSSANITVFLIPCLRCASFPRLRRWVQQRANARMISHTVSPANELLAFLEEAKRLAKRYRELTGRPLGITGEIAESEAVRPLASRVSARPQCRIRVNATSPRLQ